jgi:predicted ThiF/HesA family dinucleotide-utilizing enzyme
MLRIVNLVCEEGHFVNGGIYDDQDGLGRSKALNALEVAQHGPARCSVCNSNRVKDVDHDRPLATLGEAQAELANLLAVQSVASRVHALLGCGYRRETGELAVLLT